MTHARSSALAPEAIRSMFPALGTCPDVLLDNAGGSQVPASVADAIREYMLTSYAQLGGEYETSRRATETVDRAHAFIRLFVNGEGIGQVALGSSTTVLCNMLADCYRRAPRDGRDEIVIAESAHEANAGPWARLEREGFRVRTWPIDPETLSLVPETLAPLLSERTRVVAFPHVSNILGRIEDARAITALARDAGARVVVDGVAYAPHRAIDVADLGADWYVYSTYKVFGPHMAALFGRDEAFAELEGPNHFFIDRDDVPYKFEPGGVCHEGCAGLLGLWPYLARLAGQDPARAPNREGIVDAYATITALETALQARLLEWLRERPDLSIIGPADSGASRVATVSFAHRTRPSSAIAGAANARRLGIRWGHFYAHRLCRRLASLGLVHSAEDGVVRASLLHYNVPEEVDRVIGFLATLSGDRGPG